MTHPLRIWPVALVAAIVVSSASATLAAAKPGGRTIIAGRHEIRAEIIAATADGKLSPRERDKIMRKAKALLPAEDLPRLELTLDELSARTGGTRSTRTPTLAHRSHAAEKSEDRPSEAAKRSDQEGSHGNPATTISYDSPAASEGEDSPFREEPLPEPEPDSTEMVYDDAEIWEDGDVFYEDGRLLLDGLYGVYVNSCDRITFSATVDSFKGPMDLDNFNGNFGLQFAVNGAIPVSEPLGIGVQMGTSGVLTDFQGTQFTGATIRSQNFTTVGLFQRNPLRAPHLSWGFAYDWLFDDYYANFDMGQWRVKLGYQLTPHSELGIWACIPDRGDGTWLNHTRIVDGEEVPIDDTYERFKPTAQGILYYQRCWENGIGTTTWIGIADEPGELVFGADARIPFGQRTSLVGNFNYILPSAGGTAGQDEEMWNLSMGIEILLGPQSRNFCGTDRFAPFFPLANNGSFAVRRF